MSSRSHSDAPLRPIFLHGLWRSGSTYVWSRFRQHEGALCFYEPLHEGLGRLNPRRLARETAQTRERLRHPRLERSYFAEYEPLLKRRGVRGFDSRFARDRFALEPQDRHAALEAYVDGLLGEAGSQGRRAVLGFNRTNFRIGRLRKRFTPVDIFIARDAEAIWGSYVERFERGDHSFLQRLFWMLERNRAHPLFAPLAERLGVREGIARRFGKAKTHYPPLIAALPRAETYLMVRYLALASLAQAAARCDLVLDVDAFGSDPRAARRTQARVWAACGLELDFSGGHAAPARRTLPAAQRRAADAAALRLLPPQALALLAATDRRADLSLLTQASRDMLASLEDRAQRLAESAGRAATGRRLAA